MSLLSSNNQQGEKKNSAVKDLAKKQVKKQGKKIAKKALKKAGKLAVKAASKAIAALTKILLVGVSAIGVPTILTVAAVVVVVIIISLVFTFLLSFGGDGLSDDEQEIHEYIVEQSDSTVDMDNSFESQYRVPQGLISAVIQVDSMQEGKDVYEVIEDTASSLAPVFFYDEFNEWTETKTKECRDGVCEAFSEVDKEDNYVNKITNVEYWNGNKSWTYTPYVTEWVETSVTTYEEETYEVEKEVTTIEKYKVPYTDYKRESYNTTVKEERTKSVPIKKKRIKLISEWPFIVTEWYTVWEEETYTVDVPTTMCCVAVPYTAYKDVEIPVTETIIEEHTREIEVVSITATRHQKYNVETDEQEDYSNFDNLLNSIGYAQADKLLVDANYSFVDGESNYTDWLTQNDSAFNNNFNGFNGTIIPGESIIPEYMEYYRDAEKEYGVDWYILASIHYHETAFSTHPTMISSAGAIGHMQFMPATWVGWSFDIGGGLVSNIIDMTNPLTIIKGGGYGVDANGDNIADPWDMEDAIHTAANYLSSNGYNDDPRGAIFNYNHAEWYINKIIETGEQFKDEATYEGNTNDMPAITDGGSFMRPATGTITSSYGYRDFNGGSFHNGVDIGKNGRSNDVPIVAAASGYVVRSYYSKTYGNTVILEHKIDGTTFQTLYAHMENRAVISGQTVSKGQFLGNMGNTGSSFGAHLHFELHSPAWNGSKSNKLNPTLYVPF